MSGKVIAIILLLSGIVAGAALYYLQVYGFYRSVAPTGQDVALVSATTGAAVPLDHRAFTAIDADSSPIRFRACFETDRAPADLAGDFVELHDVVPRNAPGWFECFDAPAIAAALDAGQARVFLAEKNIRFGVDRVVAITDDGQGFVWHELNDCGEKAYDGTVVGEACPDRPDGG